MIFKWLLRFDIVSDLYKFPYKLIKQAIEQDEINSNYRKLKFLFKYYIKNKQYVFQKLVENIFLC